MKNLKAMIEGYIIITSFREVLFIPLKRFFFAGSFFVFISCNNRIVLNERDVFVLKVEAFQFLSEYHHQLHIMIGEDEGDGEKAFQEFSDALNNLDNPELIPVKASFNRIKEFSIASETVMKLDYLIDYYQSGLSLQVEAILRGRGHFETFPLDSVIIIYDSL
ncbi:MAG: hypothetical protein ACJZ1Y_07530 [Candidatus Neomarinimicrobiota bacterium]